MLPARWDSLDATAAAVENVSAEKRRAATRRRHFPGARMGLRVSRSGMGAPSRRGSNARERTCMGPARAERNVSLVTSPGLATGPSRSPGRANAPPAMTIRARGSSSRGQRTLYVNNVGLRAHTADDSRVTYTFYTLRRGEGGVPRWVGECVEEKPRPRGKAGTRPTGIVVSVCEIVRRGSPARCIIT